MRSSPLSLAEAAKVAMQLEKLRSAVINGKQPPAIGDWLKELSAEIGRGVTSNQVEKVMHDCGLSRKEFFEPEAKLPKSSMPSADCLQQFSDLRWMLQCAQNDFAAGRRELTSRIVQLERQVEDLRKRLDETQVTQ
jgi:hypothetical protein